MPPRLLCGDSRTAGGNPDLGSQSMEIFTRQYWPFESLRKRPYPWKFLSNPVG